MRTYEPKAKRIEREKRGARAVASRRDQDVFPGKYKVMKVVAWRESGGFFICRQGSYPRPPSSCLVVLFVFPLLTV